MRLKENRCTTTHLEVFYAGTLGGDLSHRKLEYVACSERTGGAKRPRRQGVEPWKESLSNFLELFDKEIIKNVVDRKRYRLLRRYLERYQNSLTTHSHP